jgi:hypothetical protein
MDATEEPLAVLHVPEQYGMAAMTFPLMASAGQSHRQKTSGSGTVARRAWIFEIGRESGDLALRHDFVSNNHARIGAFYGRDFAC